MNNLLQVRFVFLWRYSVTNNAPPDSDFIFHTTTNKQMRKEIHVLLTFSSKESADCSFPGNEEQLLNYSKFQSIHLYEQIAKYNTLDERNEFTNFAFSPNRIKSAARNTREGLSELNRGSNKGKWHIIETTFFIVSTNVVPVEHTACQARSVVDWDAVRTILHICNRMNCHANCGACLRCKWNHFLVCLWFCPVLCTTVSFHTFRSLRHLTPWWPGCAIPDSR